MFKRVVFFSCPYNNHEPFLKLMRSAKRKRSEKTCCWPEDLRRKLCEAEEKCRDFISKKRKYNLWKEISKEVNKDVNDYLKKTSSACRTYFNSHFSQKYDHSTFTDHEMKALISIVKKFDEKAPKNWVKISRQLQEEMKSHLPRYSEILKNKYVASMSSVLRKKMHDDSDDTLPITEEDEFYDLKGKIPVGGEFSFNANSKYCVDWNEGEDKILENAIEQYYPRGLSEAYVDWKKIAENVSEHLNRDIKSCFIRYKDHLRPKILREQDSAFFALLHEQDF